MSLREELDAYTRRRLIEVLRAAAGDVPTVARILGLRVREVYRQCERLGVKPSDYWPTTAA